MMLGTALTIFLVSLTPAEVRSQETPEESGFAQGVWVNFDFIPGPDVLFFTDFSQDEVGNFPPWLKYGRGNMEVAEWEGRRWLRGSGGWAEFAIPLNGVLPERFTLELEYFSDINSQPLQIRFQPETNAPYAYWAPHRSGVKGNAPRIDAWSRTDEGAQERRERPFFARMRVDGNTVKVYTDATRTANSPEAPMGRSDTIFVRMPSVSQPAMLTSIRVTGGGAPIYDDLLANGRVIARGIYFDDDSSTLRNESAPTLRGLCRTMTDNPDVAILVEGHTDSRGDEAHNLDLSQERAESVRGYLVSDCGISEERVEAVGMGEANPIASNDTQVGQQQNRRVELATKGTEGT